MNIVLICDNKLISEMLAHSLTSLSQSNATIIEQNNLNDFHKIPSTEIYCLLVTLEIKNLYLINELKKIKAHFNAPIYILSFFSSAIIKNQCLQNGAHYFFSFRNDSLLNLVPIINNLEAYQIKKPKKTKDKIPTLSKREVEVLNLVLIGQSSKMIAHQLSIGIRSVDTFKSRLQKKLNKPLTGCCLYL